uniref:pyocin knob domain-containing protein n=1 Tax=Paenochrobactrum pullorum TaxID=1324351 RepID=UPI0035BC3AB6
GLKTLKDTLAFFTGSGTADVTALTEWARTLLAAANGGKGYEALGGIPNGQLPGRLRTIGNTAGDPNEIIESGWYRIGGSNPNMPEGATMLLFHLAFSNTQARQIALRHTTNSMYERARMDGVWSPWYRMYSANNLLANVSQSNGIPTGGVIYPGNNANGTFVRFADGTQICWGKTEVNYSDSNSNTGRLGGSWTYPAAFPNSNSEVFLNVPIQQAVNWTGITGAQSGRGSARAFGAASSATGATFSIFFDAGTVSATEGRVQNIGIVAVGRWF